MNTPRTPRKRSQTHFDVATDDQANEFRAAYEEVVSGKRTRISTAAEDTHKVTERTRTGLQRIVKAIEEHPGTEQARRLVRFLAGVYKGSDYLPDGGRQMQWFLAQHRSRPQLRLSSYEAYESRMHALAERQDREADAILNDALSDLLARHESKAFGGVVANQPP